MPAQPDLSPPDDDAAPPIPGLDSGYAVIDGRRLHYWAGGPPQGPAVVLWHGFLGTGYAWRAVAAELAGAGLRILVPDLPGFGDSDKPAGTNGYDAQAMADQVRSLAARVAPDAGRYLLVAHDMGAPPALLWAARHPGEVQTLIYVEAPVMLGDLLRPMLSYTPQAMSGGSLWWWILPLAPGVPEALITGNEAAFLRWFYDGAAGRADAFDRDVVTEYLRTFSGAEGVLGSMGVYRAAFTSIEQTEPLRTAKVGVPVLGIGGERGLGPQVGEGLRNVAENVTAMTLNGVGHFVPEEAPAELVRVVTGLMSAKTDKGENL